MPLQGSTVSTWSELEAIRPAWNADQRDQFQAVKRWFYQDWLRIDARFGSVYRRRAHAALVLR